MFEERRRRVIDDTTPVDWKNVEWVRRFMTEKGRILPRRMTGNSQQRRRGTCHSVSSCCTTCSRDPPGGWHVDLFRGDGLHSDRDRGPASLVDECL